MTTWADIDQMIAEMVRDGYEPGAIIGSPVQIKRLQALPLPGAVHIVHDPDAPSGWSYQNLPLVRSYEVSGPCVVSREVYRALLYTQREHYKAPRYADDSPMIEHIPVLF